MHSFKEAQKLAKEWAAEVVKWNAPQYIVAQELAWGLEQVQGGADAQTTLKALKERVEMRKRHRGV